MELAMLLAMGLVGYYLTDKTKGTKVIPDYKKQLSGLLKVSSLDDLDDSDDCDGGNCNSLNSPHKSHNSPHNNPDNSHNGLHNGLHNGSHNSLHNGSHNGHHSPHSPHSPDYLLDVSEKITNNVPSINKIYSYLSQFDAQTFDSNGPPGANNDVYESSDKAKLDELERNLAFKEGWSQYSDNSMTYGLFPDDKLKINAMPYFSTKHGYGSNDTQKTSVMDFKNELFTGNFKQTWNKKKEMAPHFKPEANLSYIYGTPVRSEDEMERYIPSQYRQKETLFDSIKVTPGLNLGYNEVGTDGLHPMYRQLGKTLEELRINPKVVHEGRILEGRKGEKRPIMGTMLKYKPDTFWENNEDDMFPTYSTISGPRAKDNFILKETDRANQHIEYTGGAFSKEQAVDRNVPEHMRSKYKQSGRQNFVLPEPLQKFSMNETIYNPNIGSYDLPYTMRDQTVNNIYIGPAQTIPTSYSNLTDDAKRTIKEITASQTQNLGLPTPNTMRGTVHPMDIMKNTIKETTVENPLNPNAPSLNTLHRIYFPDAARTTARETIGPIAPMNIGEHKTNIYANYTDIANTTMAETLVSVPRPTILSSNNYQRAPTPGDILRPTTKETTVQIPYETTLLPIGQQQRAPNPQDNARITTKETTTTIPQNNFMMAQTKYRTNPNDNTRTTTKETTIQIPYETIPIPINQHQRAPNPQDNTRTTMKETTIKIPRSSFIVNQYLQTRHLQDLPKNTMKEITMQSPNYNIIQPTNTQRAPQQDIAKTTTKETLQIPTNTFMSTQATQNAQRAPTPQYPTKITTKETTIVSPHNHMISPYNRQGQVHLSDITKTTTRETIKPIYQPNIQQHDNQAPVHHQYPTKTTMRETTENMYYLNAIQPTNTSASPARTQNSTKTTMRETIKIPYNTNFAPTNTQRMPNPTDILRTTVAETTNTLPRNTNLSQQNGQIRTNLQDITKTTMRETTNNTGKNISSVTPVNQQFGPNISDINRTTTKETTNNLPRSNFIDTNQRQGAIIQDINRTTMKETTNTNNSISIGNLSGQFFGKANTFSRIPLRTTQKETTSTIPTPTVVTGNKFIPKNPPQDISRTTTKETLISIPYNTNYSNPSQYMGRASTFNRIPTRETIKETTVSIPYNTIVSPLNSKPKTELFDSAKTTTKETTINIPYHTNCSDPLRYMGPASSFNRMPTRETIKETTIDSKYVGNIVPDKDGYGYITQKIQVPSTNRQTTTQRVYITPALGDSKPISYVSAYESRKNEKKEPTQVYRSPTQCGTMVGPDGDKINIQLRNDDHRSRVPMPEVTENTELGRLKQISTSKNKYTYV